MTFRITLQPPLSMISRHFSSSIKKNPSLENVNASCVWQDSFPYTSEKGKVYEVILDVALFPRRDTYKGKEIIEKKLQIDPGFRIQIDNMKKLAGERLSGLIKSFFVCDNPDHYLQNTLANLIDHEPLASKNGKRFECNAWVHSNKRQSIAEEEQNKNKLQPQPTPNNKLLKALVHPPEDLLPPFSPYVTLPRWLKDHPETSVRFGNSFWQHPSGSQYRISIWVHSVPEETSALGIPKLLLRIDTAGKPLLDKIEALKEQAAECLSLAIEQRKPPIYIAAVKAAMIAEGEFPLCTDVHTTDRDIFEISAHVSMQSEHETRRVYEALQKSALKCKSDCNLSFLDGWIVYRNQLAGPPPDNILEGMMMITQRVEHTKFLLKYADEGDHQSRKELGWLAWWEEKSYFTDETNPPAKCPPLQFSFLPFKKKD